MFKSYLAWTAKSFAVILFFMIVGTLDTFFDEDSKPLDWEKGLMFLFGLSFVLGLALFLFEHKLIPWDKKRMIRRLAFKFNGMAKADNIIKFTLRNFEVYAEVTYDLNTALTIGGTSQEIRYHIPRKQIDRLQNVNNEKLQASFVLDIPTYVVYKSGPYRYRRVPKKILSKLGIPEF